MATRSLKSNKAHVEKPEPSTPQFEIVEEEPNPLTESWSTFRQLLNPLLEASRSMVEYVYSSIAQTVLEQKEEMEDRRAERKAERRRAARKLGSRRTPSSPHFLEAGSLSKTAGTKSGS